MELGEVKLLAVTLGKCYEQRYYATLTVAKSSQNADIECEVCHAIGFAFSHNLPINIEDFILENDGIKVTKDLIKRSLVITG